MLVLVDLELRVMKSNPTRTKKTHILLRFQDFKVHFSTLVYSFMLFPECKQTRY